MAELKPCPFCGGEAKYKTLPGRKFPFRKLDQFSYVRCELCNATSRVAYTVEDARIAWNRRAEDVNCD